MPAFPHCKSQRFSWNRIRHKAQWNIDFVRRSFEFCRGDKCQLLDLTPIRMFKLPQGDEIRGWRRQAEIYQGLSTTKACWFYIHVLPALAPNWFCGTWHRLCNHCGSLWNPLCNRDSFGINPDFLRFWGAVLRLSQCFNRFSCDSAWMFLVRQFADCGSWRCSKVKKMPLFVCFQWLMRIITDMTGFEM